MKNSDRIGSHRIASVQYIVRTLLGFQHSEILQDPDHPSNSVGFGFGFCSAGCMLASV